jgi:hypothetical protein
MRPCFGEILERIGNGHDGMPAGGATGRGTVAMGTERRCFLGSLIAAASQGRIVQGSAAADAAGAIGIAVGAEDDTLAMAIVPPNQWLSAKIAEAWLLARGYRLLLHGCLPAGFLVDVGVGIPPYIGS